MRTFKIVCFVFVCLFVAAVIKTTWEEPAKKAAADADLAQRVSQAIAERQLIVGMTPEQAMQSWGPPTRKTVSGGDGGSREQWVYDGTYVYFRDGQLVSWQQSR
jgi:hypothetical protein